MTTLSAKHILLMAGSALMLMACGGGGGSSSTPVATPPPPPPPPPTGGGGTQTPVSVTLSGTLTFDRVPFGPTDTGLNFNATTQMPIRFAPVELVSGTTVLDTTVSDENGDYSFTVDSGQNVSVRVRSEIQQSAGNAIDLQILDNTSNFALYALQGSTSEVPRTDQTRDLNAGSGWGGSSYTSTRAAAPFAIMDSIYTSMADFIAVDSDVNFPALEVLWSINNRPEPGNIEAGQVTTSFFQVMNGVPTLVILGAENVDTDEFDAHVVIHEFGHYFESAISRSDSIGGPHTANDLLDSRVAFGEGFGNAISGIILEDPLYRDSFMPQQSVDFDIDVENNSLGAQGWYSESSVQSILYDIFDSDDDGPDTVSLGLAPIYNTLVSESYRNTDAFTNIFSFISEFDNQPGVTPSDISPLLAFQNINSRETFGAGETNNGGVPDQLPVYLTVATDGTPTNFCSRELPTSFNDGRSGGIQNKHGNRRFLRLDVAASDTFRFEMSNTSGPGTPQPQFIIFERGEFVTGFNNTGNIAVDINLEAGSYVIEALDLRNGPDGPGVDACYNFTIQ